MNSTIGKNTIRFLVLLLLQVLALKGIQLNYGILSYVAIIIYPLFIILLPINISRTLLIILAFILGLSVDIFYDSIGVHAAASVFIAYTRLFILRFLEPKQGYKTEGSPSAHNFGLGWFLSYASIMMVIHLFIYFSIDAFSFVFIFDILIKTILSFIFSMVFIILHQVVFKVA